MVDEAATAAVVFEDFEVVVVDLVDVVECFVEVVLVEALDAGGVSTFSLQWEIQPLDTLQMAEVVPHWPDCEH